MKRTLAAAAVLVAAHAVSAPAPLDESALKAALAQRAVKVLSLERRLGPPKIPDGAFARACQSWNLSEAQVVTFFSRATAISPEDLNSSYAVLPCQHSGSISINGVRYEFAINAGYFGFIRAPSAERVAHFGCKEDCKELFRVEISDNS